MLQLRNRVVMLQEELGRVAGLNSLEDRYKAGYIQCAFDLLDIQPVDFEE